MCFYIVFASLLVLPLQEQKPWFEGHEGQVTGVLTRFLKVIMLTGPKADCMMKPDKKQCTLVMAAVTEEAASGSGGALVAAAPPTPAVDTESLAQELFGSSLKGEDFD